MKKIILINIALVALAMLVSCQKESVTEKEVTVTGVTEFTATIAQTKTAIASDGKVTWAVGVRLLSKPALCPQFMWPRFGSHHNFHS